MTQSCGGPEVSPFLFQSVGEKKGTEPNREWAESRREAIFRFTSRDETTAEQFQQRASINLSVPTETEVLHKNQDFPP